MKINKNIFPLISLSVAYLIVGIISYSTFLQIPVFPGEILVWQSIVEQLSTWIFPVIAYTIVFISVINNPIKKNIIDENQLIIPGFILFFISGFTTGIHALAQIVEDFIAFDTNSYLYKLVFIFDEYIGHLCLVTTTIIMFFIVLMEINRGPQKLSKLDNFIVILIGLFNGFFWGIGGIEGGSMYILTIPTTIFLLIILFIIFKKTKYQLKNFPLSHYFFVTTLSMMTFTLYWILKNGWLIQPSELLI